MKRLIVGVDPGLTCGLAALTLDGLPLFIDSRRNQSFSNLIQTITELGEPTIISSDVSPAPDLLEKLSQKLNAVLFTPLISMGTDEKHQTARAYMERYNLKLKNIHEVDALAAAIKAYQHYKNKFEQIELRVGKAEIEVSVDEVKDLVVRGYTIRRAIQHLLNPERAEAPPVVRRAVLGEREMKNLIDELRRRLVQEKEASKRLRTVNQKLRLEMKTLKEEIPTFQKKIEYVKSEESAKIRREREYQLLLDEVRTLRAKLSEYSAQLEVYRERFNQMQRLRELESKGRVVLLKPVEAFTKDGLEKTLRLYEIKAGDCVILLDPSGGGAATAETLAKRGVSAVVARGSMSHRALEIFAKYAVPVIPVERLKIEWIEGLPYADSENLRKAVKEMEEVEVSKAFEDIRTIVEDHRKELMEE